MTTVDRARPAAITAWYADADQTPSDTHRPEHPSRTRAWARAWQHITTENVLAYRHAVVDDGAVRETVSFFLVPGQGSPCWTMLEIGAGTGPIWNGPVVYAGSPYAEYGGAGTATAGLAAATATAALDYATDARACAIAYPGLDPDQAARLTTAVENTGAGQVLNLGTTLAYTRRLGTGMDDWWQGIPPRYRNDARRTWRRGTEAGLVLSAHRNACLRRHIPAFTKLANGTAAKHTQGAPLYGVDMLHHLAAVPGAVLLAACDRTGRLAGAFFGWLHHHNRCLYLWAAGIDYRHAAARHVYKWLLAESARWAIGHGAARIDLGRGNHRTKAKLGCRPHLLRTVVHLPTPDQATAGALSEMTARLGAHAAPYLEPEMTW